MGNFVTYAEQTLETFDERAFSSVDSLILSWLSYFHYPDETGVRSWDGVPLTELFRAEYFEQLFHGNWDPSGSRQLLSAMAASPRFRDLRLMGYTERRDDEAEKQFAALSFGLPDGSLYVAYRGTDSSFTGWKEDFNMAFQYPVPAQEEAALYLAEAAKHSSGTVRVGGHSKGGNLAVYAAANSEDSVRDRIAAVYSHDGPGFLAEVLKSPRFAEISSHIDKTVPQSSIVGMLLEQQESYRIVRSTRFSVLQHDPFSWVVEEGDFSSVDSLTSDAKYVDGVVNSWLGKLSPEERERFVDLLFGLIDTENNENTDQLFEQWQKNLPLALHAAQGLDPETKEFAVRTVRALLSLGIRSFPELFRRKK